MIAVDTNILVYAHKQVSDFHALAKRRLAELIESGNLWAIPWPCLHEFYAISSNPKIFKEPSAALRAIDQIEAWFESPSLTLIAETSNHWESFRDVITRAGAVGGAVHDARIAAICIENGVRELWTADRDFAKFKGLKSSNPLVS
jgi:uncharacterized protein